MLLRRVLIQHYYGANDRDVLARKTKKADLCEISDLLLFLSYFASLNKGIKFGNYFSDVCCVN